MGSVIPLHGKPRILQCSLRLLSSPANSNNSKPTPSPLPPPSLCPVDITSSTFIIYYCLSALVWVLKEQSSLPLHFKKRKSKYRQPCFHFKCILSLEQQQHAFGIGFYFEFLVLGGIFVFVCLFSEEKGKLNYPNYGWAFTLFTCMHVFLLMSPTTQSGPSDILTFHVREIRELFVELTMILNL